MKLIVFLTLLWSSLLAQVFTVYTEQLPPFNFIENDKVMGSSTRLLEALFKKSGHTLAQGKINLVPWSRGYHEALTTQNTILYSMARTPEREDLFKWVGPVNKLTIGLIAKKASRVVVNKPECLNNYTVAVMHDTAAESILKNLGMKSANMERFSNPLAQIKKLNEGRVDAMAFGVEGMYQMLSAAGIDPSLYETVYVLKQSDLYFAFHKETDDALIKELNEILKTITHF